ncbi:MAG TPA: apolipoprotein N-acyltransferase [Rhizomicrobium sp.]|nr:apolipoprotein N-acyltransferase [Rhizomicrobium sp.]
MKIGALAWTQEAIASVADFVRNLRGWRALALAFLSGLLSALAFAPFGIVPLLLLSLAVLVFLLDGAQSSVRPIWRSAVLGWAYGFGQFLAGLYWIAYAFLVEPLQHAWQIPFVALIFPGGLALFIAFGCALSALFWRKGASRVLGFTAAYGLAEWLRGHILTGFPWNLAGYGWGASLAVLQSVSLFGVYGLTLLTILFGASLALLAQPDRARWIPAALTFLFVAFWIGGAVRLASHPTDFVPRVRLRLVQPNVAQADKYLPALRVQHWQELIDLSRVPHGPEPSHIIWPEAAPPFLLARVPWALADIAAITPGNVVLMTGAARAVAESDQRILFRNSFYIFAHRRLIATYDKFHLVPFGEYVPFPDILSALGIDKLVNQPGSFASGDRPHTYAVPGAPPVGPLICYEILFPAEVTAAERPGWFVNVTDDAWFGPASSSGPYQHLLVAAVRAIEEGVPVARAANTGISAVIDPFGRILTELGVNRTGVVDSPLPKALPPTVFARVHHLIFWGLIGLCILAAAATRMRRV